MPASSGTVNDFPKPYAVQFKGSALARRLMRLAGWRVEFDGLPAKQGVLAAYPHTSNWDFVVMVFVKWAIGLPVQFLGKDRLFAIPLFGRWLRWLGGVPVLRTAPQGVVGQCVATFKDSRAADRYFWLGLAPEGTRKVTAGWRSGFYQTAWQADVPLGLIRLDYGRRTVTMSNFIRLTGDEQADFARIVRIYSGVTGFVPGNAAPIQPLEIPAPRTDTIVK